MKKLAIAFALLAAACGAEAGDEDAEAPENRLMQDTLGAEARPEAESGALTVTMDEWNIRLANDTIQAVGPVTFRVRNNGEYAHILEVEGQGSEWVTDTIPPGDWATLETTLEPGSYELYCPIDGEQGDHSELGMVTYLVVESAG